MDAHISKDQFRHSWPFVDGIWSTLWTKYM